MTVIAAVQDMDDQSVIQEAKKLANNSGEELEIIHVLDQSEFVDLETTSVEETGTAIPMEEIRQKAEERVDRLVNSESENYEPVGLVGKAADEITKYASNGDTSYLVIGGRKRSPVGKAVFGSTTQTILLNAECPVLVVRRKSD